MWLLSDGQEVLQSGAALLVGQLAAPPLNQADFETNSGELKAHALFPSFVNGPGGMLAC